MEGGRQGKTLTEEISEDDEMGAKGVVAECIVLLVGKSRGTASVKVSGLNARRRNYRRGERQIRRRTRRSST